MGASSQDRLSVARWVPRSTGTKTAPSGCWKEKGDIHTAYDGIQIVTIRGSKIPT
jgi:hypothetical protein